MWSKKKETGELVVSLTFIHFGAAIFAWTTSSAKMGSRGADALKMLGMGDKKKTKKKDRDNQEYGWVEYPPCPLHLSSQ